MISQRPLQYLRKKQEQIEYGAFMGIESVAETISTSHVMPACWDRKYDVRHAPFQPRNIWNRLSAVTRVRMKTSETRFHLYAAAGSRAVAVCSIQLQHQLQLQLPCQNSIVACCSVKALVLILCPPASVFICSNK